MNKGCMTALIVVAVLFVVGLVIKAPYNSLVTQDQSVKSAWAQVENDLQRRNDLIPQLVGTVKGVAGQEQKVFGQIADARARIGGGGLSTGPSQGKIQASNDMSNAISRLLVISENYPQLKSSENFTTLQDQIEGTENRLAHSRENYNRAVQNYNQTAKSFPAVLYVRLMGFKPEQPYFTAPSGAQAVPTVDFSDTTKPVGAAN